MQLVGRLGSSCAAASLPLLPETGFQLPAVTHSGLFSPDWMTVMLKASESNTSMAHGAVPTFGIGDSRTELFLSEGNLSGICCFVSLPYSSSLHLWQDAGTCLSFFFSFTVFV